MKKEKQYDYKEILMKFIVCLILAITCIQASPTLQDIQNASYHLPCGWSREGRGGFPIIDKSHTVKFVDGRGSDAEHIYWIYGTKGTPDFSKVTDETLYKMEKWPLLEEDQSIYAVQDSIAVVVIVESNAKFGGDDVYQMILK